MSVGDSLRKAAASAAGVAMATAGLSSCKNGFGGGLGAVDPPPPPFMCSGVQLGQSLVATATRRGDSVAVVINNFSPSTWRGAKVIGVSGATLGRAVLPVDGTNTPVEVVLTLGGATTASISFGIEAQLVGERGVLCEVRRTFMVTVGPDNVTVAQISLDELPLPARDRAEIVVVSREGQTVTLQALTPFHGPREHAWEVSGGRLASPTTGALVHWTLPTEPGIYSAEVALDYGKQGLAFDVLMLEVLAPLDAV